MKQTEKNSLALLLMLVLSVACSGLWAAKIGGGGGSGVSTGLNDSFLTNNVISAATSARKLRIGDGVSAATDVCIYTDGSGLGGIVGPCSAANTRSLVWTNQTYAVYDIEGSKDVITVDPDAFATGSGTVTVNTDEQLVVSNLGLEIAESASTPACGGGNYTITANSSDSNIVLCLAGKIVRVPSIIYKTADEPIGSSTALQNDNHLIVPVVANATYEARWVLRYSAATTGDLKFTFTLPASATGEKSSAHAPLAATTCSNTSTTLVTNDITQTDANVGGAGTGAGNICLLVIDSLVTTAGTAGNITLQWAQVASDATNTTVHAGSYVTYRRIDQ